MIQRKIRSLLFLLLLSNWAFAQAPSIRYELPTEAEAGVPFLVNMKLDRGAVSGIARIQQSWPKGFSINEKQSAGAIFSFSKTQLQLLWVTLPDEQEINIQIEVTASKDYTGKISIPSLLAFLENTTRKEQPFPPISIEIKGKGKKTFDKPIAPTLTALATSTEKPSPKPTTSANPVKTQTTSATSNTDPKKPISTAQKTEVKKENPTDKKESAPVKKEGAVVKKEEPTSKKEPVASNNNPVKKENQVATKESPAITKEAPIKPTVPAAEKANSTSIAGQITFRIQVSALPSKGDKESIAKEFGVEGKDLREENHNSLFKYTYGEYPNLTEARKKMNTNPKMKGKAFITGYRNGQRIDLEEAIRLSKEK